MTAESAVRAGFALSGTRGGNFRESGHWNSAGLLEADTLPKLCIWLCTDLRKEYRQE